MQPNPYESSAIAAPLDPVPLPTTNDAGHDLLRDWEYRRLWFNGLLIAETVLIGILPDGLIFQSRFWIFAIEGAIVANVCFCVGPIATWYLSHLGFNHRRAGVVLFWAGTILSMIVTLFAIFANFVPWQD